VSANALPLGLELAERGLVPGGLLRWAIRRQCERHAARLAARSEAEIQRERLAFRDEARRGPVALVPEMANAQHYDVPAAFFAQVLGTHRKYSASYWAPGTGTLDEAEAASLRITCERAELRDGMRILELGCGWGSLSLWMASRYPRSRIVAISNSAAQREHIVAEARRRGLGNLEVRTLDMNAFQPFDAFDRVVSVEMFEHMRNWEVLLERIERALAPGGRVFLHVFCHRFATYPYATAGHEDWLGRHFFTGGMMPSRDYLRHLDIPLEVEAEWTWNGDHYRRTAEAWVANLDRRRNEVLRILAGAYGPAEARRRYGRWRIFFVACAEMFGTLDGNEWMVVHFRLKRRGASPAAEA
jgi:cyclopropane-fatty-acyl-phospholipid synthase